MRVHQEPTLWRISIDKGDDVEEAIEGLRAMPLRARMVDVLANREEGVVVMVFEIELGQRGITDAWENALAKAGYGCRNVSLFGESAIREAAAAEEAAAEERYMQTRDYHYERKEPTT